MTAIMDSNVRDVAQIEFAGGTAVVSVIGDNVVIRDAQPTTAEETPTIVLAGPLSFVAPDHYCPPEFASAVRIRSSGRLHPMPGAEIPDDRPLLPHIPRLDMSLIFETASSPFGVLRQRFEFRSGHVESVTLPEPGPVSETDVPLVIARMDWADYLDVRAGRGCALEAVEDGGGVEGDWQALLATHGILQHPAWAAWWTEVPPASLLELGALTKTDAWAELFSRG